MEFIFIINYKIVFTKIFFTYLKIEGILKLIPSILQIITYIFLVLPSLLSITYFFS
jgi:hypothetical protein